VTGDSCALGVLCEGFARRGIPVSVIDIGDRGVRSDGAITLRRIASLAGPIMAAVRMIPARRSNVYLAISQSWAGFCKDLVFVTCARLGRHRLVLHLYGGSYDIFYAGQQALRQRIIRSALANTSQLVVLGSALKEMYSFVPDYRGKVVVVPNGLAEELPDWKEVLRAKAREGEELRILYLSNLMETKGYVDVLEAVRILVHDHNLNVKADFCGEFWLMSDCHLYCSAGEAKADFLHLIQTCGLSDRVTWHGSVTGNRKHDFFVRAHYFVLPTYNNFEGQQISIIEAMAYGALVISTRYRTIPEMLDDGRAGVFVAAKRPDQIVEAVLRHPFGSSSYRAIVEAARKRCVDLFSRERHLDQLIAIITGAEAPRQAEP
jgi:glycosyltransferase involved in cell wall biosynthesis